MEASDFIEPKAAKAIIFATGNQRKIAEATMMLEPLGIHLECRAVDIDEIQHHDPVEITKAKARAAYEVIHQPVVVQDTSCIIPALSGFPGGYMKDVSEWWTPEDWLQIMARHEDRSILCLEHVAYFDGEQLRHFEHTYSGHFADSSKGEWGNSIEKVVCLYGEKTLAEVRDLTGIASAGETLHHWQLFGEWFIAQ